MKATGSRFGRRPLTTTVCRYLQIEEASGDGGALGQSRSPHFSTSEAINTSVDVRICQIAVAAERPGWRQEEEEEEEMEK